MSSNSSGGGSSSRWRKAKTILGRNMCVYVPRTYDNLPSPPQPRPQLPPPAPATTTAAAASAPAAAPPQDAAHRPANHSFVLSSGSGSVAADSTRPALSASSRRLSKSSSKSSSKNTCAICLGSTKPGHGQALFTAECSHIFHFHCIASNVKHGNQVCPVCRAKWKDIPFHAPSAAHGRPSRVNPLNYGNIEEPYMAIVYGLPRSGSAAAAARPSQVAEPVSFDDDEPVEAFPGPHAGSSAAGGGGTCEHGSGPRTTVECKTYPEFPSVQRFVSLQEFTVLVHLKAPATGGGASRTAASNSRTPVDLVTVLDVSGSMAGTKLALLKRAMGFVIQNLGPADRLSVVTFSSTARRLFPLRRMSESGKLHALQAVNALTSSGGTNIVEGLKKASKVMEDRREKNPVCGIILLSDGQDTFTVASTGSNAQPLRADYTGADGRGDNVSAHPIPVHTFGFGIDHDATALHSISESSGGTFSFVETEGVIQDAFAQCIGGLLSVVVQDLHVKIQCVHPGVRIGSIKSGSYAVHVRDDNLEGGIEVGDLYADEERDFLVSVNVPASFDDPPAADTALLTVECAYTDPVSKESATYRLPELVKIQRTDLPVDQPVSIEVDRQRNRLRAASAMASARAAAERGNLLDAVHVLENCRQALAESASARAGDRLCTALDAELKEMQDRMASRQRYEESGRAYMLSGLSSHLWQRATARGDSTESTSLVGAYQTPSMTEMLQRSQTLAMVPAPPRNRSSGNSGTASDKTLLPR